jgi:hypothetical protein
MKNCCNICYPSVPVPKFLVLNDSSFFKLLFQNFIKIIAFLVNLHKYFILTIVDLSDDLLNN